MAIVTNNTNDQYNGISEFPPHPYVLVAVHLNEFLSDGYSIFVLFSSRKGPFLTSSIFCNAQCHFMPLVARPAQGFELQFHIW